MGKLDQITKEKMVNVERDWRYIAGQEEDDISVQISPNGELALIKNYESTKDGVKKTYTFEHLCY